MVHTVGTKFWITGRNFLVNFRREASITNISSWCLRQVSWKA